MLFLCNITKSQGIENYVDTNFNKATFLVELSNLKNHYYIIYDNDEITGYSKITLITQNTNVNVKNIMTS